MFTCENKMHFAIAENIKIRNCNQYITYGDGVGGYWCLLWEFIWKTKFKICIVRGKKLLYVFIWWTYNKLKNKIECNNIPEYNFKKLTEFVSIRKVDDIKGVHSRTDNKMTKGKWGITCHRAGLYMIDLDQRPDSNRHPLTSLSQITVRFKGFLISASFPNSQIYGRFIVYGWVRVRV